MLDKTEVPNSGSNIGICTTDPVFTHVISKKSTHEILFSSKPDVLKTCMTLYKKGCRQIYIDGSQLDTDNLIDLSADPIIGLDKVKKIFFNANDRTLFYYDQLLRKRRSFEIMANTQGPDSLLGQIPSSDN